MVEDIRRGITVLELRQVLDKIPGTAKLMSIFTNRRQDSGKPHTLFDIEFEE